jgi:hypothetical protein
MGKSTHTITCGTCRLQVRFIELAKPKMVLIENVPPRSWGDNPTEAMYQELASKIKGMEYSYTAERRT